MSKENSVLIFLINFFIELVKGLLQTQGAYPALIRLLDLLQGAVSGKEDVNLRHIRQPWPQDGSYREENVVAKTGLEVVAKAAPTNRLLSQTNTRAN